MEGEKGNSYPLQEIDDVQDLKSCFLVFHIFPQVKYMYIIMQWSVVIPLLYLANDMCHIINC